MKQVIEALKQGTVYEFCTEQNSWLGKFVNVDGDDVYFEDVVKTVVTMMPIQNQEGKQELRPVPKMEIINFYTTGNKYRFKVEDIVYVSELDMQVFLNGYNETIAMYNQMKIQSGSNITIPTVDDINNMNDIIQN